jgi:hypothetical protein
VAIQEAASCNLELLNILRIFRSVPVMACFPLLLCPWTDKNSCQVESQSCNARQSPDSFRFARCHLMLYWSR